MTDTVLDTKKNLIIEAIERCRDANGVITRQAVFEAAQNPNNILHTRPGFKWDKNEAWREFNLEAAARVIRSVKVQIVVKSHKMVVPVYVNHPSTAKPGAYIRFDGVKSDEVIAHGVLLAEMSRIENALRRAMAISCALDLNPEFNKILDQILVVKDKITKGAKK